MNILVTGGAGYIGAHCCKELSLRGYHPIVFDNLCHGHREHVRWGRFLQGDIRSAEKLEECLSAFRIDAVMHFAGFIEVGESVADPQKYYANNVAGTLQLLQALVRHRIMNFVFSSSAAVYGSPQSVPIDEGHLACPVSPYGWTKLIVEFMLADFERAYGLHWIALRYFNAAGADAAAEIGERHEPESHLIPRILDSALNGRRPVQVYGGDYPTSDGSCIRDYIHVTDLARAHVLAVEHLLAGRPGGVFNLGQGDGYSVLEVLHMAAAVTGRELPIEIAARRPGDAAVLVASNRKAREVLGWVPEHSSLENIIASAWRWQQRFRR